MSNWAEFVSSQIDAGATPADLGGISLVGSYGDPECEYHAIAKGPALLDRCYRGLLEVAGSDRASWLHGFTTNHVKTLATGEGNYAFATNAQGRILFDLNILMRDDAIWVDLDKQFLGVATPHFEKYIITEDVSIVDRSDDFVRFGLAGDRAATLLAELGGPDAAALPSLAHKDMTLSGTGVSVARHDFCGTFGVELYVPSASAVRVWRSLTDPSCAHAVTPAGYEAARTHRIESGIPSPGDEITEEALPAETGQLERAVAFDKGCYLGQEVIERMRSRDALARRLVGLQMEGGDVVPHNAILLTPEGKPVGKVTSACRSRARSGIVALGYVKTTCSQDGRSLRATWDGGAVHATVTSLPNLPAATD